MYQLPRIYFHVSVKGGASSRLNMFLVLEALIDMWRIVAQDIGKRDIFDHSPIWIKSSILDRGPKSFKANKCWFDHQSCMPFMKDEWKAFHIVRKKSYLIKEK